MVSKLESNPSNSHDCLKKLREGSDVGNISTDKGKKMTNGLLLLLYCRAIIRSGIYSTGFKHDNSVTIHIHDLTCKCNCRESHLSDFVCSISEYLLCQPSSKSSSCFYLFNIKLNCSDFFFYFPCQRFANPQDRTGKPRAAYPVFAFCFCIRYTSLTVNSNMLPSAGRHSNVPGVYSMCKAAWSDTGVNSLP